MDVLSEEKSDDESVSVYRTFNDLQIILKRGKYQSSNELANKTLQVVEKYAQSSLWKTPNDIMVWLRQTAVVLAKAAESESAPFNIINRVIKTIQEDVDSRKSRHGASEKEGLIETYAEEVPGLRSDVQNAVWELYSELDSSFTNISEDAEKHIHPNEVILTIGKSRTVESFLKKAIKKHKFEVIVAEGAPFSQGRELAKSLSKSKINTTLIEDTAVFSIMPRVDKVFIGTHTVLANGGLKGIAGVYPVTLAAKYYNVPVFVLAALYKLSPEYPLSADVKIKNRFVSPEALANYHNYHEYENVHIYVPLFDYVPPNLVSLFIFNIGSHAPSYIYRLLHETYPQD